MTLKSEKTSKDARRRPNAVRRAARGARPKRRDGPILDALRDDLRLRDRPLGFLAEMAAMPIILLSPDLTVLAVNQEAERVFEKSQDEFIGQPFFHIGGRQMHGRFTRADFKEVLAGHPVRGIESRLTRPDGSERILLWNTARVLDPAGAPLGVIAVAQDITDRKKTEEALREREARLSSIIATAPDGVITIDESGLIQSFSNAAEEMFGYAAGEVIGKNIKCLMPPPYREQHDEYLRRYRRTGIKRIIGAGRRVEGLRKDGTVFPLELSVGEVPLGSKRIFTGFVRDVSAREKMEDELRQAQKMEAVGQLTGGLAHDFNNLLTVIIGNLEILEGRLRQSADRRVLAEAQAAADRGAKIANRLLAFGRRQALIPKPIDLSALIEGMIDLLRRSLGANIRVDARLDPDVSIAMADPGQVESTLLNLAINARDAMPEGGHLLIETAEVEVDADYLMEHLDVEPGRYVTLTVSDTGFGMPPDVRRRAFEPFFTTKERGGGSGLGLSMVYGFVKQSGGHVQLYSEPGLGTTVRIYLPVHDSSADQDFAADELTAAEPGDGERILLVEDDEQVRNISVRRLKEIGYRVIEAGNAREALSVLEAGEIVDLLFTDVVMPGGMNGLALARAARGQRPELRILFTSGYAGQAALDDGLFAENADWLGKPYKMRELAAKLRRLLDR